MNYFSIITALFYAADQLMVFKPTGIARIVKYIGQTTVMHLIVFEVTACH